MKNELIIFFSPSEACIFRSEDGNFKNVKIKGERFYQYENLEEALVYLADYLKNVISIEDNSNNSVTVFSPKNQIDGHTIKDKFGIKNITSLSFDAIFAYQNILNLQYGEKYKKLVTGLEEKDAEKKEIQKLVKKMQDDFTNLNLQREKEIKLLKKREKELKDLQTKADNWDNYIKEKSNLTRTIVFDTGCISKSSNKTNWANIWEEYSYLTGTIVFNIGCISKSFVKKGSVIAITNSGKKLTAEVEGYIYWMTSNNNPNLSLEDFKIKDNNGSSVLAVISSSPDDNIDEIIKYVKKEISRTVK
jgi:arsenate reductase-like glutaredoxin family protein